jgi:RES domain-containing protein
VTVAWRLASARYPPLAGEGARLVGGRWNSPGFPLVYASESLALALAESLVHIPGPLPRDYAAFKLQFPDAHIEILDRASLKSDWSEDIGYTRAIGDQWIQQNRTLALAVPSAILFESMNILINPNHPAANLVVVVDRQPFRFDPRLHPEP